MDDTGDKTDMGDRVTGVTEWEGWWGQGERGDGDGYGVTATEVTADGVTGPRDLNRLIGIQKLSMESPTDQAGRGLYSSL